MNHTILYNIIFYIAFTNIQLRGVMPMTHCLCIRDLRTNALMISAACTSISLMSNVSIKTKELNNRGATAPS
jgi:hypothetical protein